MPFKFFIVPVRNADDPEEELNGFLNSHRVLSVDRRWVARRQLVLEYLRRLPGIKSEQHRKFIAKYESKN